MTAELESDLPVLPGVTFGDEPRSAPRDPFAMSPTARFDPDRKSALEYEVLVECGAKAERIKVRDSRTLPVLRKLWLDAYNRVSKRGDERHISMAPIHATLDKESSKEFSEPTVGTPAPWVMTQDHLVEFTGDESGVGAACYFADLIKGIVKL